MGTDSGMLTTTPQDEVATAIVSGQRRLMGEVAWKLAARVPGVRVDDEQVQVTGDPTDVIEGLVAEFSQITGPLGVRLCYTSAKAMLSRHPEMRIPSFMAFG